MKSTTLIVSFTTLCAFVGSYFMELTAQNAEQYLAIISVSFVDGILGIIAGTKKEGFKTYKAIKVLKTTFMWIIILTLLLMIELGFKGTGWLSETICAPFIIFQIISILKNASSIGYINNSVLVEILKKIDQHKN